MNDVGTRIERLLQATPDQQRAIDQILTGQPVSKTNPGPLLLRFSDAAKYAGISRSTLWRLCAAGHIPQVEIRPGSFRVRREDIERFAEVGLRPKSKRVKPAHGPGEVNHA